MKEQFYKNCIIEDRKSRKFLDFSDKKWFKEFIMLAKTLKESNMEVDFYFQKLKKIGEIRKLAQNSEFCTNFSFSKPILDFFISNDFFMVHFLNNYKQLELGNIEEHNQRRFPIVNLPIIRMMDYFLEKKAFKQFAKVMQKLEEKYIIVWFESSSEIIDTIIIENMYYRELWYIFAKINQNEFEKYFKPEYLPMVKILPFEVANQLLKNSTLQKRYIDHEYFLCAFRQFTLEEQIDILELMEDKEYDVTLIKKLRTLLNKVKVVSKKISLNQSEMNYKDLIQNNQNISIDNLNS